VMLTRFRPMRARLRMVARRLREANEGYSLLGRRECT
jgi:hypothetical protein